MQNCSGSLPIGMVPKINKNICTASILLFFIEQKYCFSESNVSFSLSFTIHNLRTLKEAWFVQFAPQEFVRTPCCFFVIKWKQYDGGIYQQYNVHIKLREARRAGSDVELEGPTGGIANEFRLFRQTLNVHANRVSPANVVIANAPRVPEVLLLQIFIQGVLKKGGF